jgi:hypothetical protein
MADDADKAADWVDMEREDKVAEIRKKAQLDPGKPGDCDLCGEWSGRLIVGVCAPCRDRHGLP